MKRVTLEELAEEYSIQEYNDLRLKVLELINEQKIKPVNKSGTNGMSPALYRSYWVIEEQKDYSKYKEELQYQIDPMIKIDYYLKHMEQYEKDREWVLRLNQYLKEKRTELNTQISVNERSFSIWQREKFLIKGPGKRILKQCGIELSQLGLYETSEPMSYYVHNRNVPQNMLIIENKDTFYTFRKYMMQGNDKIFGITFGTLIFGGGKALNSTFSGFEISCEPYMADKRNTILYFGDIDYEGIGIYESFEQKFGENYRIKPFTNAYEKMLEKAYDVNLPDTKEGQNRNISKTFFGFFDNEHCAIMQKILQEDKYIPQEILNIMDLQKG